MESLLLFRRALSSPNRTASLSWFLPGFFWFRHLHRDSEAKPLFVRLHGLFEIRYRNLWCNTRKLRNLHILPFLSELVVLILQTSHS